MPSDPRILITSVNLDLQSCGEPSLNTREDRNDLCSPELQEKLAGRLAQALAPAIAAIQDRPLEAVAASLHSEVRQFQSLYATRPLTSNKGGMQFNDSLCLHLVARALSPRFVLESGSFQGHSAWLLRQTLPEADILSCDIDLSQLRYRADGVRFHEGDWTGTELPNIDPAISLAWFDDHTDHCRRLAEAQRRGFRHVLLDDNFPAENLYATGGPPIPTLAMALDTELKDGQELIWRRRGKTYRYRFEIKHTLDVASRIEKLVVLPDVTQITRYNPPSGMTYVRLKPLT